MNLINKNILIVSPESWGINFVSKHHYAKELSKKNVVYFLNPPTNHFKQSKYGESLIIIDIRPIYRGLGHLPPFLSATFTKFELKRLEKKTGIRFDIIWNFDSSRFFNLAAINDKLKIAHLVDLSEDFQRPLLCKTSDICFGTSEAITKKMRPYNSGTFNIGHGVQNNDSTISLTNQERSVFNKKFKFKAAYIGNLTIKYLDWKTLYATAQQNLEVAFYFIGPLGISNLSKMDTMDRFLNEIQLLPNTFFLGSKLSNKIPAYLDEMDVLLTAYKANQYKEQLSNPHKILEYLASGNVLITSWTEEYMDKSELLEMVESNDKFPVKFKEVISNLNHYNSSEKQAKRKAFSQSNIYEKKIQQIEQLISENVK